MMRAFSVAHCIRAYPPGGGKRCGLVWSQAEGRGRPASQGFLSLFGFQPTPDLVITMVFDCRCPFEALTRFRDSR